MNMNKAQAALSLLLACGSACAQHPRLDEVLAMTSDQIQELIANAPPEQFKEASPELKAKAHALLNRPLADLSALDAEIEAKREQSIAFPVTQETLAVLAQQFGGGFVFAYQLAQSVNVTHVYISPAFAYAGVQWEATPGSVPPLPMAEGVHTAASFKLNEDGHPVDAGGSGAVFLPEDNPHTPEIETRQFFFYAKQFNTQSNIDWLNCQTVLKPLGGGLYYVDCLDDGRAGTGVLVEFECQEVLVPFPNDPGSVLGCDCDVKRGTL